MEFERYGVKIQSQPVVNTPTTTGTPTLELLRNPTSENLAEFAWRAGLPLIAINLMLLAIPLAYQNPRRSRTINLVMAVLIYLTYSNVLNVVQSWIQQGKMSFPVGLLGPACRRGADRRVHVLAPRAQPAAVHAESMFSRSQGA